MMGGNVQNEEQEKPIKYIVVSGGVISGIGKGVIGLFPCIL
jgi:plastocyanin domain-containing protein